GTPCHGEVRIDGEIDLTRLPPGASRYLVRDERGHKILVHGYYWIYRFDPTTSDELAANYVDISPQAIARLLEGFPVAITKESYEGNEIFRFELGIVLPEAEREEPPPDAEPVATSAKTRSSTRRSR
ncbi:MAG TPA: hypothetical protein VK116_06800, partial [Planctomycetota bacterium]|nr:hypothetical protein [Planctomycetota bacterium]